MIRREASSLPGNIDAHAAKVKIQAFNLFYIPYKTNTSPPL
jgi:hypothetical protein